jgi:hypothetical protein
MKQDLDNMFALLDQLVRLHEQMIAALDRQLAAARAADGDSMRRCQEQTEQLVRQVAQVEAQRRALSRNLALQAGIDAGPVGRGVTASSLAAVLLEPDRSRLIHQAGLLRQRIQEVDRLNKVLADVSRRILLHLKSAYDMVARAAGTTGVYAANGRLRQAQRSTVFETVG